MQHQNGQAYDDEQQQQYVQQMYNEQMNQMNNSEQYHEQVMYQETSEQQFSQVVFLYLPLILGDKIMDDKLVYIPNDEEKQNYTFCRLNYLLDTSSFASKCI